MMFLALGMVATEKLDRKYLPPPGAKFSGGNPEDLQVPFQDPQVKAPQAAIQTSTQFYDNGLLRSGYYVDRAGLNVGDIHENAGDTLTLRSPQGKFPSTSPITPQIFFPTISTPGSDYESTGSTFTTNLENNAHVHGKPMITPSSNKFQKIPITSIPQHVDYRFNYESSGEVQPKQYAPNGKIMQQGVINSYINYEQDKLNAATLPNNPRIPKLTVPTRSQSTILSHTSRQYSSKSTFSKKTGSRPERIQADGDRKAVILNYHNDITPEGFSYSYDISNGISANESGTANNGVRAQGAYSYIGDDGKVYKVVYTADENGFQPRGEHIPTPPPVPVAIKRLIEKAAREKEAGLTDDGSYDEAKYGHKKYHGAMERFPPEMQGFTNEKRNQYGNYQKQKLRDESVRKYPVITPRILQYESNMDSVYLQNNSGIMFPSNKSTAIFEDTNIPLNEFKIIGDVNTTPVNINQFSNIINKPYIFTPDKMYGFQDKEDENDFNKLVKLDNIPINKKIQQILSNHSQNAINIKNQNFNQTPKAFVQPNQVHNSKQDHTNIPIEISKYPDGNPNQNIPEIIRNSYLQNTGNDETLHNRRDMGYVYVTPQNKFDEITNQLTNIQKNPFNTDQELAIGDDDIITISVPLRNTSSLPGSESYKSATTESVNIQNNIKDANREIDYLDSSKIPVYFVDSTTMSSNINVGPVELSENGFISSTSPFVDYNYIGYPNNISQQPEELQVRDNGDPSIVVDGFKRPIIIDPANENYSTGLTRTPEFYGQNAKPTLYNGSNLDIKIEGKLKTSDANKIPYTNIKQDMNKAIEEISFDENNDKFLRAELSGTTIGEDFSGPKRPQTFDPETGYYY